MGPTKIGGTLTSLAAISFGVSAFFFSKVQEILGLTLTAAAGLVLVAVGLCGVGLAGSEFGAVAAAAVYVSGIPLFTPAVPILLMQCVPKNQRGAVMGLDSAVNSVARIATPIAFGKIYVRRFGTTQRPVPRRGGGRRVRRARGGVQEVVRAGGVQGRGEGVARRHVTETRRRARDTVKTADFLRAKKKTRDAFTLCRSAEVSRRSFFARRFSRFSRLRHAYLARQI
jgi:hypothetical protein